MIPFGGRQSPPFSLHLPSLLSPSLLSTLNHLSASVPLCLSYISAPLPLPAILSSPPSPLFFPTSSPPASLLALTLFQHIVVFIELYHLAILSFIGRLRNDLIDLTFYLLYIISFILLNPKVVCHLVSNSVFIPELMYICLTLSNI